MATADDYTSLVTSEHRDKQKFMQVVGLMAQTFADIQNTTLAIVQAYDLDQAVDDQLDTLGLWIGLSRYLETPITGVYFEFNNPALGWNQGIWRGPFDSGVGITRLDNDTYRLFLRAKIQANHWDGTIDGYNAAMDTIFAGTGTNVTVIDNQDMSMDVVISGTAPTPLQLALISQGYLGLKPVTVRVNGYYMSSVSGTPVFAFNAPTGDTFAGWNIGSWAVPIV